MHEGAHHRVRALADLVERGGSVGSSTPTTPQSGPIQTSRS
jgi:hypothetical protein